MKCTFFKIQIQHLRNIKKLKEHIYKKKVHLIERILKFYWQKKKRNVQCFLMVKMLVIKKNKIYNDVVFAMKQNIMCKCV